MTAAFDRAVALSSENGRVCPMPMPWNELWEMLPARRRAGLGWEPPLPLILAAWREASNVAKREVLGIHLRWAAEHGMIAPVLAHLESLQEAD